MREAVMAHDPLSDLKTLLGPDQWTDDPSRVGPYLTEWRGRWHGHTPILLLPRTPAAVSEALRWCWAHDTKVVTQGGGTGLVGGQIPFGEVLLSTRHLRAVRDVAPLDDAMVLEAGITLLEAQEIAARHERLFPLSLAAEGTATLGGVAATNAGGTAVLRYGMMRDLVLGLEAVLADGRVFNGLKRLRKDNTGYDLKQLLIGSEGTLGVITALSLKMFPLMRSRATAMVGLDRPDAAIRLLERAKAETGGGVDAFELMKRLGVDLALKNVPDMREPLETACPWYLLIELASGEPGAAEAALERLLAEAFDQGLIVDAAVAQNAAQAAAFWRLREEQSAAQKPEGLGWKHDVSVPVSRIADFLAEATAVVEAAYPGARVSAFGHVGDGNLHYDVLQPVGADAAAFAALRDEGSARVHDIVARYDGSISAEHGLGRLKSEEALRYKDPVQVEMMRAVRDALDPRRILNPAVLF